MIVEIGKVYKTRHGRPVRCLWVEDTKPGFTPFAVFKRITRNPLDEMVGGDVIRCFVDEVSEWDGKEFPQDTERRDDGTL